MTIKYTKDHEWVKIEEEIAIIGITSYATEALGELVYVELPSVGKQYKKGDAIVVVESSKSASDVYMPISGEVVDVNQSLISAPEIINNDPNSAWLIKIKPFNLIEIEKLMSEDEYKKHLVDHS